MLKCDTYNVDTAYTIKNIQYSPGTMSVILEGIK